MPLVLNTPTDPGTASWDDLDTLLGSLGFVKVIYQTARFTQADFGHEISQSFSFGTPIPSNTVFMGGLLKLNDDVDVGGSGISTVTATLAASAKTASDSCTFIGSPGGVELLGVPVPFQGRYVHGYDLPTTAFNPGSVGASTSTLTPNFAVVVNIGNFLDEIVTFDVSVAIIYLDLRLTMP